MLERLTSNFAPLNTPRRETLNGREYLIAPVTLIVPGVLSGSKGALYYPPEEVQKSVAAWNNTPITIPHPTANGVPISASDPAAKSLIAGFLRNAAISEKGNLVAEAWLDVQAARMIDSRVVSAVERGVAMEVSTGLFTENEASPGTHNGRDYAHVAKNYRPDHLAILPDQAGACSLTDGCGLHVANTAIANCAGDVKCKKCKEKEMAEAETVANCQIREGVCVNCGKPGHREDQAKKHEAAAAAHEKAARAHSGQPVGNADMKKSELIAALIANVNTPWLDEDHETLEGLAEEKLTALLEGAERVDVLETNAKPTNLAEWLALMPADAKPTWDVATEVHNAAKTEAIGKILANCNLQGEAKTLFETALNSKDVADLRKLAEATPAPAAPASRPVFVPPGAPPTANGNNFDRNDVLPVQRINWAEAAKLPAKN